MGSSEKGGNRRCRSPRSRSGVAEPRSRASGRSVTGGVREFAPSAADRMPPVRPRPPAPSHRAVRSDPEGGGAPDRASGDRAARGAQESPRPIMGPPRHATLDGACGLRRKRDGFPLPVPGKTVRGGSRPEHAGTRRWGTGRWNGRSGDAPDRSPTAEGSPIHHRLLPSKIHPPSDRPRSPPFRARSGGPPLLLPRTRSGRRAASGVASGPAVRFPSVRRPEGAGRGLPSRRSDATGPTPRRPARISPRAGRKGSGRPPVPERPHRTRRPVPTAPAPRAAVRGRRGESSSRGPRGWRGT